MVPLWTGASAARAVDCRRRCTEQLRVGPARLDGTANADMGESLSRRANHAGSDRRGEVVEERRYSCCCPTIEADFLQGECRTRERLHMGRRGRSKCLSVRGEGGGPWMRYRMLHATRMPLLSRGCARLAVRLGQGRKADPRPPWLLHTCTVCAHSNPPQRPSRPCLAWPLWPAPPEFLAYMQRDLQDAKGCLHRGHLI